MDCLPRGQAWLLLVSFQCIIKSGEISWQEANSLLVSRLIQIWSKNQACNRLCLFGWFPINFLPDVTKSTESCGPAQISPRSVPISPSLCPATPTALQDTTNTDQNQYCSNTESKQSKAWIYHNMWPSCAAHCQPLHCYPRILLQYTFINSSFCTLSVRARHKSVSPWS